ncbi:MAG: NUMOD3 domain-containing DNA-binding protein [Melioribacteraceae bacterium]|jgi:group I intron endonuclease|nr:NUMOD3 domain-containing DNA-binding protein [Melioribacteraceae bacterium]
MNKITGIYKIQSIIKPERIYIGSATDTKNRWIVHKMHLRKGDHHSPKLQRHYDKYGENDLVFSLIIGCDKEDLIKIEQFYLDTYKPIFNNCSIAGNTLGFKMSDETKLKMSKMRMGHPGWNKGKKWSEESRAKMSIARRNRPSGMLGHKHSEESRFKMSIKSIARKHRPEVGVKIGNALRGKKKSAQHCLNLKIAQIKRFNQLKNVI